MAAELTSPTRVAREAQMFPILEEEEIARVRRFGAPRRYAKGEIVYATGKPVPGLLVVLSGTLRVTGRDGHGHDLRVTDHVAGGFSGELGLLSGRRALREFGDDPSKAKARSPDVIKKYEA